ncbi:MAG: hypothetical protein HQ523_15965 [Lentisphaerae bacterium]|nr:hypothetical protein [Lentisphaerota bacterium]
MRVSLSITVDVDSDGTATDNERTVLCWRGVEQIPSLANIFARYALRCTWFVRADRQLRDLYGGSSYLLNQHQALWSQLGAAGDEIAWHPHLYCWSAEQGQYVQEHDEAACAQQIEETHAELGQAGHEFHSVRLGEAFGSNTTMAALTHLGLHIDSTAIPGRRRDDGARRFDWESTTNTPYHPARSDYRVSALSHHAILEVPMTTIPVQSRSECTPLLRYVNLAYHHDVFRDAVEHHLNSMLQGGMQEAVLVLILHPDEVIERSAAHALYAFSLSETERNAAYLVRAIEAVGADHQSLRMKDIADLNLACR